MSQNKGTAAMLVSPINPPGIELFSYADVFFCFWSQNCIFDTEKKNSFAPFARFARAFFIFGHVIVVLVLSTT